MAEGLLYEPDFIDAAGEAALLEHIRGLTLEEARYKSYTAKRRTASFGFEYDFDHLKMHPAPPMPAFLDPLRESVAARLAIPKQDFVHTLVTEYRPGTELGWHRDVPEFEVVVGISLAGPGRMRFRRYPAKRDSETFILDLEPRSIYVLRDEIRWRWQHSVSPTPALRYSITFRTRR
jgi:alkylated DNA repair dioxygenase AlkB